MLERQEQKANKRKTRAQLKAPQLKKPLSQQNALKYFHTSANVDKRKIPQRGKREI